ncbi:unnamed protein product, partial [marine sediment metagenome]
MRVNGLDYHLKLTNGEIPYTDPGIEGAFKYWRELVDAGYFIDNHTSYSW